MVTALLLSAQLLLWSDLDTQEIYKTNTSFELLNKKSAQIEVIPAGLNVEFYEIAGLDMINVTLFQGTFTPCTTDLADLETEMEIIDDTYGVEINKGCKIDFYLESKDLGLKSTFSATE